MNLVTYALLLCYMLAAGAGHVMFWYKHDWTRLLIASLGLGFILQCIILTHDLLHIGHVWGSASFNFIFMLVLAWTGAALLIYAVSKKILMALFAGPLGLLCLALAAAFPGAVSMGEASMIKGVWLSLHIHLMLLAYLSLGLGFICALAYLGIASRLHHKVLLPSSANVSLESLNRWVKYAGGVGLALLSFGLLSGWVWADLNWQGTWVADPKVLASLLAWALTAAVVGMRARGCLQGHVGMWLTVLSFVVILAGLLLDQLIPSTYHHFL